jgi:solute carrier family 25 carnitine/acylcarnitine transporter 20/29
MDYLKGALSGGVATIVTYPFDTIKVHIQDGLHPPKTFRGLYRGLPIQMIGACTEKSIVFGTYGNIRRVMEERGASNDISIVTAGALSGLVGSLIITPMDRFKILMQTGRKITMKGLYNGFGATLTRDVPGYTIYFLIYNKLYNPSHGLGGSFLAGCASGALSWVFIYPQDLVKTRIQSGDKGSYLHIMKNVIVDRGIFGIYRGFSFALFRSIPFHGMALGCNEILGKHPLFISS